MQTWQQKQTISAIANEAEIAKMAAAAAAASGGTTGHRAPAASETLQFDQMLPFSINTPGGGVDVVVGGGGGPKPGMVDLGPKGVDIPGVPPKGGDARTDSTDYPPGGYTPGVTCPQGYLIDVATGQCVPAQAPAAAGAGVALAAGAGLLALLFLRR